MKKKFLIFSDSKLKSSTNIFQRIFNFFLSSVDELDEIDEFERKQKLIKNAWKKVKKVVYANKFRML